MQGTENAWPPFRCPSKLENVLNAVAVAVATLGPAKGVFSDENPENNQTGRLENGLHPGGVPAWVEQGGDPTDTYCTSFYAFESGPNLAAVDASLQLSH